jgi:hypothetical protein
MLIWPRHNLHLKPCVKEILNCAPVSLIRGKELPQKATVLSGFSRAEKLSRTQRGHLMWLVCVLFGSAELHIKHIKAKSKSIIRHTRLF